MGILHGLERRLRGAVDSTFARIFGGSVQPAEVTAALQREAAAHVTNQGGHLVAPNSFTVDLGPSDSADVGDDLRRVSGAFSAMLGSYVRDQGWETYAEVVVTLSESRRLHTGQFRVRSAIDPGVGRRHSPAGYDDFSGYDDLHPALTPASAAAHGQDRHQQSAYPSVEQLPYSREQFPYREQPPYPYGQPAFPRSPEYPRESPEYPRDAGYGHDPNYPSAPPYGHDPNYPSAPPYGQAPPRDPANLPRLAVQDGTGRSHPLHRGSNVVGRGQTAALRLADTAVSREHIDVYFDGQVAIVHDLGSTNGTTVNGSSIQTWQLADGDVIRLGQSTVVFHAR